MIDRSMGLPLFSSYTLHVKLAKVLGDEPKERYLSSPHLLSFLFNSNLIAISFAQSMY